MRDWPLRRISGLAGVSHPKVVIRREGSKNAQSGPLLITHRGFSGPDGFIFQQTFDFNFDIKAIVAIAPVDGQYRPASVFEPLENVNYLVIHGSHDGDVSSFDGLRQFHPAHSMASLGTTNHGASGDNLHEVTLFLPVERKAP